ncbi:MULTISPECIES: DUF917 domain-containing protein [Terrisporobacter]|uniref:Hydantoinase n=1 Tax=Terrisporobacter othiniensis TaxID=1577792 RepID=A0A0B3W052_9FIRM|nr:MULTISPECIES: DUF917 domain-containing protein [Terrisporobacter]KHS58418.1 hypothetical protein QX51_02625 [Terrisporobacter othiniensis]MCC3669288.1 DUF917 domain-containing protein [Terrisporobacter mayombei]MDY3374413.1 DUF917 domain-containing protein [Terrisporobacter othiniensis]
MRLLTEESIEKIAIGAAVLGTGGGGDPYVGKLLAKQAIKKYGPVKLISIEELEDDALVVPVSGMGAPTITIEKLLSEVELTAPLEKMEELLNKKVDVIIPIEIGGINSLMPIAVAAQKGLPILDADAMGRAFPEAQMVTFYLAGYKSSPVTMADEKGNTVVIYPKDGIWAERLARTLTIEMGGSSSVSDYALSGKQVKSAVVENTLTIAENIGKTLMENRSNAQVGINKMLEDLKGYKLFEGKIVDIKRELKGGFTRGHAYFKGINEYTGDYTILFQNEHLIAKKDDEILCTTPDLIAVLDLETGIPITTERMKYGSRVVVVAFPCNYQWRSEKGLEVAGPKYFGYEVDYVPVEKIQGK